MGVEIHYCIFTMKLHFYHHPILSHQLLSPWRSKTSSLFDVYQILLLMMILKTRLMFAFCWLTAQKLHWIEMYLISSIISLLHFIISRSLSLFDDVREETFSELFAASIEIAIKFIAINVLIRRLHSDFPNEFITYNNWLTLIFWFYGSSWLKTWELSTPREINKNNEISYIQSTSGLNCFNFSTFHIFRVTQEDKLPVYLIQCNKAHSILRQWQIKK